MALRAAVLIEARRDSVCSSSITIDGIEARADRWAVLTRGAKCHDCRADARIPGKHGQFLILSAIGIEGIRLESSVCTCSTAVVPDVAECTKSATVTILKSHARLCNIQISKEASPNNESCVYAYN